MASDPIPEPTRAIWIAFSAMVCGNFIANLDTQIVASALSDIQAGILATPDEIAWVQTSYIIAEVIAVPLSGFLMSAVGARTLFTVSTLAFVVSSALCAMAWDLPSLILFRTLQGFVSGGLVPVTTAMVYTAFPIRHQATAMVVVSLISTSAPTIGPTLGGWIAETLSWRWLFWVNVVPGIAIAAVVWANLKGEKTDPSMLRRTDFISLLGLATMLGCAQYVLAEGHSDGWDSMLILSLAALSVGGGTIFFWRTTRSANPIVDLRPFADPRFVIAMGLLFVMAAAMFVPLFLQPLFLAQIRGWNPAQIGHSMWAQGLTLMLMAPLFRQLMLKITDPRAVASLSFGLAAVSCWMLTQLTSESSFGEFLLPQILRAIAVFICFTVLMRPAFASLPLDQVAGASGLFHLIRLLGGAFGLAAITTLQSWSIALHRQELYAAANPGQPKVQDMLAGLAQRLRDLGWRGDPDQAALGQYQAYLDREALVMSFNDQFLFLAVALCAGMAGVWLLGKAKPVAPPPQRDLLAQEA